MPTTQNTLDGIFAAPSASTGLLSGMSPGDAVNRGATHAALVMTTPGDTSMVNAADVDRPVSASGARVIR